jgi:enediyne biosynthesis protein E4
MRGFLDRRGLIRSLCRTAAVFSAQQLLGQSGMSFTNVAKMAGLTSKTTFGGEKSNRYLLETTGCGVAFIDYDNDGWIDLFFVNGTRFDVASSAKGQPPVSRLYKNNRDGTFTDVTVSAGVAKTGWGQGVCVGDYDNDGFDDLFVSYYGDCVLFKNNGDGTFTDVAAKAGVTTRAKIKRWNTGCAFVDYDRDGNLDLFVANYIDFEKEKVPVPEAGTCLFKGLKVACGPPGLPGAKNILFRNNGDGTFTDVSEKSGILKTPGTYGLGVLVSDFDNDGWPDIYVANDSTSAALYRNNRDGTFSDIAIEAGAAFSPDGKPQAGMGVAAADYNHDGFIDIVKTNFQGDTSSLYANKGAFTFDDQTFQSGLGRNTRFMGWGAVFQDLDNDGWADILLANGHVYPEVGEDYRQRKVLYRNNGNGRFTDVSETSGPGILERSCARGLALGDFDNDGDLDAVVNNINDAPHLLRNETNQKRNWLLVKCKGTTVNRSAIGARVLVERADGKALMNEVRSGDSYNSQSDLRAHFGLDTAVSAKVQIRWPNGVTETFGEVKANQVFVAVEGQGLKPAR